MKKVFTKFLHILWKDKGILFLFLIVLYAASAGILHQLYKGGAFATKHYKEQNYNFAITKTNSEECLNSKITNCSDEVNESAKKGDTFTMDESTIYYQNYEYKYYFTESGSHDYVVEFPNGETYAFDQYYPDKYYIKSKLDLSEEKAAEDKEKETFMEMHNAYWETQGMSVENTEVSEASDETSDEPVYISIYLPLEAPDGKYSPALIYSALSSYQRYTQAHHLCNSEKEIFSVAIPLWILGTILLCLTDQILEWQMAMLAFKMSYETTAPEQLLEPSDWSRFSHLAACLLLLLKLYWYDFWVYIFTLVETQHIS